MLSAGEQSKQHPEPPRGEGKSTKRLLEGEAGLSLTVNSVDAFAIWKMR